MRSTKIFIVLCVVIVSGYENDDCIDFKIIDSITPEPPCSSQGGLCTIAKDCPQGSLLPESGLCPKQQSRGVECCQQLSVKETRCRQRGGECMNRCSDAVKEPYATNCPKDTTCCIVVKK